MRPLWCPSSSQDPQRHIQGSSGSLTPSRSSCAKVPPALQAQGQAPSASALGGCVTWLSSSLHHTEHVLPRRSRGSGLYPSWAQKFSLVHALTAVQIHYGCCRELTHNEGVCPALQTQTVLLPQVRAICISSSLHYPLLPLHTAQCGFWHCQALLTTQGTHVKDGHSLVLTISF